MSADIGRRETTDVGADFGNGFLNHLIDLGCGDAGDFPIDDNVVDVPRIKASLNCPHPVDCVSPVGDGVHVCITCVEHGDYLTFVGFAHLEVK